MNCPARPLIAALITVACFAPSSQAAAPPANLVVVVGTAGQGNIGVIQIGAGTAKMTGNLGLTGTGNTISVQATARYSWLRIWRPERLFRRPASRVARAIPSPCRPAA